VGAGGAPLKPARDELAEARFGFRVLGPIELVTARGSVNIGGPKERSVLAHLLARANHTVSVDALVDGVWAGQPPDSAERTIRAYVARLRKAMEPGRRRGAPSGVLVTEGRGYRLQVGPDQFDALRFEQLARHGAEQLRCGDTTASRTLREALGLWTGDAYAEFADVEPFSSEARRLDELRLVALEDRVDADIASGAGAELVAEIDRLVADHPFRERLWGQLMVTLYRAGRQRDALAAYGRARSVLVEELGVEPGPDLRRLEAAILAQDPALDGQVAGAAAGPTGLPAALDAVGPAFVGRDRELAWLGRAWAEAEHGRGRFVTLLGPEGVGKARLVAELARQVDAEGSVVLYGRCDHAHRGARTLFDQVLRSAGGSLARVDADGHVDDLAGAVARFLPGWAQGRPVLVVLDDLHLADAEALEVVADFAGWCAAEQMLVVGAFRSDATPADDAPVDASAQLVLGGLDDEAVRRICALYAGGAWSSGDMARLYHLTDGVPLRVHELASEWAREREDRRVADAAGRLTGARVRLAASRVEIADSVEGIGRLIEQRRAQLAGRHTMDEVSGPELCPYKGLARFEAADAANFFGRERLVAELVARLPGASLLTVFGPSGSGKSSLVRAGVLPALAAGVLPGANRWRMVTMCPGPRPGRELSRHLRQARHSASDRLLVFVDQFEEAFTLCCDDTERDAFIERLLALLDRPDTVVLIAVRADHVGRFAGYPALAEQLTNDDVLVGPMRDDELRRVIELPARRAGLDLEPGLAEVIVAEVAGRAGALPLLSTALAETWERRHGRALTVAGYRASGGVNGAVAGLAEDAYQALPSGARTAARRLLLRLCDSGGEGAVDLRRRLSIEEAAPERDTDARAALAALVDRRLLTVDRDTVEVAHEALLREWPRLRTWLDEDVQGRRVHRHLAEATRSWEASGHDRSELYRGTRLDGALDWAAGHNADLNERERAFLDAGRAEAEREVVEARRRAADKTRTSRRLVGLLAGVGILLVAALVAGLLAVRQGGRAEREARDTRARELAGESTLALDIDPELGMLLALEAVEVSRAAGEPVLPEARAALHEAVQASRLELRRPADDPYLVDASPDGDLLATGSYEAVGEAVVWDAGTGERLHTLIGPTDPATDQSDPVQGLAFARDGLALAVTYGTSDPEQPRPAVILWDPSSGAETGRLLGPAATYRSPAFSPDGRAVAAISTGDDGPSRVTVWDVGSASVRFSFEPVGEPSSLGFHPDGRSLIVAEWTSERAGFYSADEGHEIGSMPTPGFGPDAAAVDPTGNRLAMADSEGRAVTVWDLNTQELLRTIPVGDVWNVDWSPDGRRLAIGGGVNQGPVRIVEVDTGEQVMVLRGHTSGSADVAFIGAGDRLASVGGDLRVWNVTDEGPAELGAVTTTIGTPLGARISPDGAEVGAGAEAGAAYEFLSAETGELLRPPLTDLFGPPLAPVVSPSWRLMGLNRSDGHGEILELPSLSPVRQLPACTSPRGFSPDGSLLVLDARALCTSFQAGDAPLREPPAGADLRSRVIDLTTDDVLIDLSGERGDRLATEAVFNPAGAFSAGRYLAVAFTDGDVEIYDVEIRESLARLEVPGQIGLRFDPEGRWLAGRVGAGRAWVLDLAAVVAGASGDEALVFDRQVQDGSSRVALSDDGILATAGNGDGVVRLWDFRAAALLLEFRTDRIEGSPVGNGWIELSPDGSYLLYMDAAGVFRRFLMDVEPLIDLAERRLTRGFTQDECVRYLGSSECS
jgi:DNA-binding SARP family transcriptional activator/WD40 repeat protein